MKQETFIDTKSLIQYADGDLSPPDAEEMRQHFERNPRAKERLLQLQQLMQHIGTVNAPPSDIDFVPVVRAAVAANTPRHSARLLPRVTVGLAACLAVGLAVVFAWLPAQPPVETPRAIASAPGKPWDTPLRVSPLCLASTSPSRRTSKR